MKVLVQPANDSFEAMATLFFSSRSVKTWNSSSAPRRSSSMCWVGDGAPCTLSGVGLPVPALLRSLNGPTNWGTESGAGRFRGSSSVRALGGHFQERRRFSQGLQRGLVPGGLPLQPFHLPTQLLVLDLGGGLLRAGRAGAAVDQVLQGPGIARGPPLGDVGVVQALAAQDRALLTLGRGVVLGRGPKLVLRGSARWVEAPPCSITHGGPTASLFGTPTPDAASTTRGTSWHVPELQ